MVQKVERTAKPITGIRLLVLLDMYRVTVPEESPQNHQGDGHPITMIYHHHVSTVHMLLYEDNLFLGGGELHQDIPLQEV